MEVKITTSPASKKVNLAVKVVQCSKVSSYSGEENPFKADKSDIAEPGRGGGQNIDIL